MTIHSDRTAEWPTHAPVDVAEEMAHLRDDATAHGVDPVAAAELAQRLARTQPLPDAIRAVDRRLATGYDLEQAAAVLLVDGGPPPAPADSDADMGIDTNAADETRIG